MVRTERITTEREREPLRLALGCRVDSLLLVTGQAAIRLEGRMVGADEAADRVP